MKPNVCLLVSVSFSVAIMSMGQNVLAKNPIESALRKAENSLCKVVTSKNCSHKKSKKLNAEKPVQEKLQPPASPVIYKNAKPPLPPEKPFEPEVVPPEPVIDVKPDEIPPEPVVTQMPSMQPQQVTLPRKNSALPPIFLPAPASPIDAAICQATLSKLGVIYTQNPVYVMNASCVIANPVQLKSNTLNNQKLEFPDQPIFNCAFALQFINFIHESAAPILASQTKSQIAKLYTGPGFVCRGRNGDSSAKMSEHAMGNAVDIERIELADGRVLLVKDAISAANKDYEVLTAVRHASCAYFTTVLGPGANEAHATHFHFDLGQHGKTGTYRICE